MTKKPEPDLDTVSVRPECRAKRGVSKANENRAQQSSEHAGKRPARTEISLRTRAMKYLVRREHSRTELHAKLLPHVTPEDDVDAVLDDLVARGWLSDARAAEQMVRMRRNRFGTQRIAHELRQKGIAENLIGDALPQLKETELEAVREVWAKKFGVVPQDAREKAKQVRFLQSRGFALDVIFKVVRGAEPDE